MPEQAQTSNEDSRGKVTTFRPPDDVEKMLVDAEEATGATRAKLCIESLRESLPKVVHRIDGERSKKAREFAHKYKARKMKL